MINATDSLTHSLTTSRKALPIKIPLIMNQFRGSWSCHLDFNKEVIPNGWRGENGRYRWGYLIFK